AIAARDVAVDRHFIPDLGVARLVDRHVVMLAPEKWHGIELLSSTEHVARGRLALALCDDPVFDPDRLAAVRVGPAGDVARGEDARRAGLQVGIDSDATVDRESG